MTKIIAYVVNCCDECPYTYFGYYEDNYGEPIKAILKCKATSREIGEYEENKGKIADFCPLNEFLG